MTSGLQPAATCKRDWGATGGHRGDFMVGCPLVAAAAAAAAAAALSCKVRPDGWIVLHLAVRALFDCCRWDCRVTQPVPRTSLFPASWLPAIVKGRGSKSVEVRNVWMSWQDAQRLSESLNADDVSRASLVCC